MRRWIAAVLLLAGFASPALAGVSTIRGLGLPSRQGAAALARIADQVAAALARRLNGEVVRDRPAPDLVSRLEEARTAAAAGALDQATTALETAIAGALDALHRMPPSADLLDAHVELAAIALARDQPRHARDLLERVLELDAGFELRPEQRSPRLVQAFAEARTRRRRAPELRAATLGRACADGARIAVVARSLENGAIEVLRFDDCRLSARVRTSARTDPASVAAALDPIARPPQAPFYKRWWFWGGTAAVAVAAGSVAAYFLLRDEPQVNVVPVLSLSR
jgi:hypothetical protein